MSSPIRWGIIGLGRIAHKFASDLQLVEGAQLSGVASRSLEKAEKFGKEFGARHFFGSYESLLESDEIDVVYIATPHTLHFENTMMCLKKGKPVLCEKPFAMKEIEVRQMIDMAREKKVFLMEAMWTRFFPLIHRTISIVNSGELGKIRSVRADFGFHKHFDPESRIYDKSLGGGSLLDVGIYPLFLALLILGEPERIEAYAPKNETGIDESCFMHLHYKGEVVAQLMSSVKSKTDVEAWIYGSKGSLKIFSRFHHPKKLEWGTYYEGIREEEDDYPGFGYQYEIEEVCRCLRAGQLESDLMTHQLSIRLIHLLDAVRKAAGIHY
jgi:predicted dehydrogenase